MQSFKKLKMFFSFFFFTAFLKSRFNFEHCEKKISLIAHVFPKL